MKHLRIYLLLFSIGVFVIVGISWFLFPEHRTIQGIFVLIGIALLAAAQFSNHISAFVERVIGNRREIEYEPRRAPKKRIIPDPGGLPIGSWVPVPRNNQFTGREEDLFALADVLVYNQEKQKIVGLIGSARTFVSIGMGGIGKTQLANEFCYRYGKFFLGVHWIQADQDFESQVANCGARMGLQPWPTEIMEQANITFYKWQQDVAEGNQRLIVLDNLNEPNNFRSMISRLAGLSLLVTTKWTDWPTEYEINTHKIHVLNLEESRSYLRKLAPRLFNEKDSALDNVADKLGYLPLALHLAGSYLKKRKDMSCGKFLEELDKKGGLINNTNILEWVEGTPTNHIVNLAITFHLSWELLEENKPDLLARKILRAAGYCAPNVMIPYELLAKEVEGEEG